MGLFRRSAWRLSIVEKSINIQIYTQLTYLTIIIGIKDMLLKLIILVNFALRTFHKGAILILVGIKIAGQAATGVIVVLVESTQTMVLVNHVVYLKLWRETFPYLFGFLLGIASNHILAITVLHHIIHIILLQRLAVTISASPERCC